MWRCTVDRDRSTVSGSQPMPGQSPDSKPSSSCRHHLSDWPRTLLWPPGSLPDITAQSDSHLALEAKAMFSYSCARTRVAPTRRQRRFYSHLPKSGNASFMRQWETGGWQMEVEARCRVACRVITAKASLHVTASTNVCKCFTKRRCRAFDGDRSQSD